MSPIKPTVCLLVLLLPVLAHAQWFCKTDNDCQEGISFCQLNTQNSGFCNFDQGAIAARKRAQARAQNNQNVEPNLMPNPIPSRATYLGNGEFQTQEGLKRYQPYEIESLGGGLYNTPDGKMFIDRK